MLYDPVVLKVEAVHSALITGSRKNYTQILIIDIFMWSCQIIRIAAQTLFKFKP